MIKTALALVVLLPIAFTAVDDDSCWSDSAGREVTVEVDGLMFGNQRITVTETVTAPDGTETTNTGSTDEGTPNPNGGCEDSDEIKVGDETYKVENGKLKRKNDQGDFVALTEDQCSTSADDYGSLPKHN